MGTTLQRDAWIARALDTSGHGEVKLGAHPSTMSTYASHRRRAPLGQFFGLIQHHGMLLAPRALYRGLLRPLNQPGHDDDVIAYITTPSITYTFNGAGQLVSYPAPRDCVFVVFVSFSQTVIDAIRKNAACESSAGAVLDWEWTQADAAMPFLPADYQTRYRSVLWTK